MRTVKYRKTLEYGEECSRLFPEKFKELEDGTKPFVHTVTLQVTDECNLACTYCYQINKGVRKMSFETAKKFIDNLLTGDNGFSAYVNTKNSPGIIIEFIGGEPFLCVDLIDKTIDYFMSEAIRMRHPWAEMFRVSICSNGVLYRTPEVQAFLKKHKRHLSFTVTLDGNKELHDKCRVFKDGKGSYDLASDAYKDWTSQGNQMGTKITISPDNVSYLYDALTHMISLGSDDVHANTVYENVWDDIEKSREFYRQMKKYADFAIDAGIVPTVHCALFDEEQFCPLDPDNNSNFCGGTGAMLSVDPDGYLYPCIRYMESSLGSSIPPLRIGHIDHGLMSTEAEKKCVECLNCITRRSQSTDECFNCPIASGCGYCSAYCYQTYGTADKRTTFHCPTHKARALANVYYWNMYYRVNKLPYRFANHIPDEWALEIIDEEELAMLKELAKP